MFSRFCAGFAIASFLATNLVAQHTTQHNDSVKVTHAQPILVNVSRSAVNDPVTNTTITSAKIGEQFVGQDPQFFLQNAVPSLVAFSESGTGFANYGSFRLRGMDQTRVSITLNGVPLNDMIDQGVFFSNVNDVLNSTSSVQIQRGVGSSDIGTASYAGSLSFETIAETQTTPSAEIQLGGGSFGLLRASAAVHTGLMDGAWNVNARFTTFTSDGYRKNTATTSQTVYVDGSYKDEFGKFQVVAILGNSQNGLGYYAVPKPIAVTEPTTSFNDVNDADNFGQRLLQLLYTSNLSSSTTGSFSVYVGGAGGDFVAGYRDTANVLTQINYPLYNTHVGAIATVRTMLTDHVLLTGGIHAYTFRRKNLEQVMPDKAASYYSDKTQKNEITGFVKAGYTTGSFQFTADVQVRSVGLEFERPIPVNPAFTSEFPTHTFVFVNPKVGATYTMSEEYSAYVSFGRIVREPTRYDLLGSTQITDANAFVLLTPNTVKPEYVHDFEVGVRANTSWLRATLNGYVMQFSNEIAPIGPYIEQGFVQLRKNVASSSRSGVELEATANVLPWLQLNTQTSVMQSNVAEYAPENTGSTEVFNNVEQVLSPTLVSTIAAEFKPLANLSVTIQAKHVGKQFLDLSNNPTLVLDAFTVLDARVQWKVGNVTLLAMVNNLTDELYASNGTTTFYEGNTVPALFIQAPLSVVGQVQVSL